jgi:hypothetical protein
VFDNPAPEVLDDPHYERAINLCASIAWHFFQENTELSFAAPGLAGSSDVYGFLEYLATVAPRSGADFFDSLDEQGQYHIIVTARPRGQIPTALWQSSYVLFAQE